MSEYQYYEFVAVDRPLDDRERGELRALSTRAYITPTSFVNVYHWGDLRGNPRTLVERYFDAFLYLANWGTRELMLRLPKRLLDLQTAQRYCDGDSAAVWTTDDDVILAIVSENENEDFEEGGEGRLASITPVRAELASGDLRLLYLAWLLSVQAGECDSDESEPPVPAGMQTLTGSLRGVADFLRVDADLLSVAAEGSAYAESNKRNQEDLARWIDGLAPADKDAVLLRLLQGDQVSLRAELLRCFDGEHAHVSASAVGTRTVGALLDAAQARRVERERRAEQQRALECARRQRQEAAAREQRLTSLATQEEEAWQRVSALIATKKPREYDTAVALLQDLRAVSERQGISETFDQRRRQLRHEHASKPSLLRRLDSADL